MKHACFFSLFLLLACSLNGAFSFSPRLCALPKIGSRPTTWAAACNNKRSAVRMAVGDIVELGDVQKLEQLPVSNVQEALKRAISDGCKVCDLISMLKSSWNRSYACIICTRSAHMLAVALHSIMLCAVLHGYSLF